MASIVAAVFTPFCRRRQPEEPRRKASIALREIVATDHERVAQAMRHWSALRAEKDMAYVPLRRREQPPQPPPAPTAEPEPPVIQTRAIEALVARPAEEAKAAPEPESQSVAEPNPFLNFDFQGAPEFLRDPANQSARGPGNDSPRVPDHGGTVPSGQSG